MDRQGIGGQTRLVCEAGDEARRLHALGLNVGILRPGTRKTTHPWREWGSGGIRQTDADLNLLLARAGADFDLAILLGLGWAALDVDSDTFAAELRAHDGVAEWMDTTARSRTGSGKVHLIGTYDPAADLTPRTWRRHEDGVDGELLAAGALIVAPPSRHHRTGRRYEWEIDIEQALPLPAVLFDSPWGGHRGAWHPGAQVTEGDGVIRGVGTIDRGRQPHYVDITLQGLRRDLGRLTDGRKTTLHAKAFHVGANVATCARDLRRARLALVSACHDNGLIDDLDGDGQDGEAYCWDVTTRALQAGWRRARAEQETAAG